MSYTEVGTQIPGGLLDLGADAAAGLLGSATTQTALNSAIANALESKEVRGALRPLYFEAGLYMVGALAVGGLLWSLFKRI